MIRKFILLISASFILVSSLFFYLQQEDSIYISVFEVEGGFGYKLSYGSKLLIKQENIPTIQKITPFCTREDAEKTAKKVRLKIIKKHSPSISLEELKELKIKFNCVDLQ